MTKIRTSRHNRTHQTLHEMALADTRAANPFDPREIRLSAAGACPRQQTLRILGAPATPESVTQLSIFHAGHYWEDYLASLWEAQYPSQVNRQVTVDTPYGTGHIDLWIEPIIISSNAKPPKSPDVRSCRSPNTWIRSTSISTFGATPTAPPAKSPISSKKLAKFSRFRSSTIPTGFPAS